MRDDADSLVRMYREAVKRNVNNDHVRPMRGQTHVQVAPEVFRHGSIILPGKPKELGTRRIWCRYGTVLTIGESVDAVSPGDIVFFSNMLGVRYRGRTNPLRLEGSLHDQDEFRILRVTPQFSEIWGIWTPSYLGHRVNFRPPGGETQETIIVDESPFFGGRLLAQGDKWIPYKWLVTNAEK